MVIEYKNLAAAQEFYKKEGYTPIETPWLVSSKVNSITAPEGVRRYFVTKGDATKEFIASGEQGFLYLAVKGYLPPGKYQTITPCLRDDSFDFTHMKQFVKCELIEIGDYNTIVPARGGILTNMLTSCQKFFQEQGLLTMLYKEDKGTEQYDLIAPNGTEIGSYGYRSYEGLHWIYGTGIAEPRFSRVLNVLSQE